MTKLLFLFPALFSLSARAEQEIVRITSVNQNTQLTRPLTLNVNPGDVVSVSADVQFSGTDENRALEEFIWSTDSQQTSCAPSQSSDCLSTLGFQLHDDGVHFYVPYSMAKDIRISVRHPEVANSSDTLVLHNIQAGQFPKPPSTVVTSASNYPYQSFSVNFALAGMGRWVFIGGTRHWVPYTYESGWVPFRHGYWTWVDGQGWNWISYDPWGWYTDHYGIWRHHVTFGWVWMPTPEVVYHPAPVTWISVSAGIGWYPYYHPFALHYALNETRGFDDGFSMGLKVNIAERTTGYTMVANHDFLRPNIAEVTPLRTDPALLHNATIGENLGHESLSESKAWVEARAGMKVPTTTMQTKMVGKTSLSEAVALHSTPPRYSANYSKMDMQKNIPVGSMLVNKQGTAESRIIPPTQNGRDLSQPPANVAPRSRIRSIPNPEHPYSNRARSLPPRPQPNFGSGRAKKKR